MDDAIKRKILTGLDREVAAVMTGFLLRDFLPFG
jgi:uncharacterized membrane protein YjjP (DUF1212 family)